MERLLTLMIERNKYLEKYYNLNEREIRLFKLANFQSLDAFYDTRQAILEVISALDSKIDEELKSSKIEDVDQYQNEIAELLTLKDEIIERILDQDLQIISLVENEKSKVLNDLNETRKNRKVMNAYGSNFKPKVVGQDI